MRLLVVILTVAFISGCSDPDIEQTNTLPAKQATPETVDPTVQLTLSAPNVEVMLPETKDESFSIPLTCTIKNLGTTDVVVVDPTAYKLFPHPYELRVNGTSARLWSGDIICAPNFRDDDKVRLEPNQSIELPFEWHVFVQNFSSKPGTYTFQLKYEFNAAESTSMGAKIDDVTAMKSEWSNETTVRVTPFHEN